MFHYFYPPPKKQETNKTQKKPTKNKTNKTKKKHRYHNFKTKLFGWLFGFYGISTFVGHLTQNPFLYQ